MKKWLFCLIGIFSLSVVFAAPKSTSSAKEDLIFSPAQQSAIQMIVHQYLVQHPEVLVEVSQALQQKQIQAARESMIKAARANADQFFRNSHSPVAGNPNGTITLVAFLDYNCPYCRAMTKAIMDMIDQNKNLRVVFKEYPIHGEAAIFAAKAALAAGLQNKYLDMHEAMMGSQEEMNDQVVLAIAKKVGINMKQLKSDMAQSWIQDEITANTSLAQEMQIPGTPAFIITKTDLQNNEKGNIEAAPGMVPEAMLKQMVNRESRD